MKVILKRMLLLLPLMLLLVFTNTSGEVVKIDDYVYSQDGVFVKTDSSEFSAAGITADGRLFTWGWNLNGQLGTGDNIDKTTPTDITPNFSLNANETIVNVSVGNKHMIVVTSENRFFGMGYNGYRQIGNNSTINSNLPVDVTANFGFAVDENIIDIAAGENATYVLTDAGRYFSWGYGLYGRLGNGSTSNVTTITDHTSSLVLGVGEVLVDIDVYDYHVLAISDAGNLYGWGYNGKGQLFMGDTVQRTSSENLMSAFTFDVGETITHFSAGHLFNIVVTSAGKVYTAGTNQEGQIGDGTSMDRYDPTDITNQFSFGPSEYPVAVDTAYHTMLMTNEGRVFGWGRNSSGCIAPNVTTYVIPTDITGNFSFEGELPLTVSVSAQNTYILSDDNRLYSWGSNYHGQIGNGYLGIAYNADMPIKFEKNFDILIQKDFIKNDVALFKTKYSHSLLLLQDGHLFAWGDNDYGAVGNGSTDDQLEPLDITDNLGLGIGETVVDFSTGRGHSVLLTSDYRVFTWGFNFYGQVGIDSQVNQLTPIDITSNIPLEVGDYIIGVFAGGENTFLISNDGNIFAFGRNLDGCLGDGTTTHQYLPIDVTANWGLEVGDSPSFIMNGGTFTFLITHANRIYSVGDNSSGQLADGTTIDKANPIQVTSNFPFDLSTIGIIDFQIVAAAAGLLNENNELYMWGSGNQGLTGSGGISFSTPTMINNQFSLNVGEVITSLSSGASHTLVTTSEGRVFGYGFGIDYGLITGYTINVLYPYDVTSNIDIGSDTIDYLVLGHYNSFIITEENNLFAIGRNGDGELGLGDTMIRQDLNKVTKDSNDLAGIKFIYMQEEQYVLNQYVYIEIYFEHKIGDYLTGLTINGTIYDLTNIDEDVGKVTVRIPNTYTVGETPVFIIENVWFELDSPVPSGPVDVSCTMANDIENPSFDPIADQYIQVGFTDVDWTTYIMNLEDNSPGIITLSEIDPIDYDTMNIYIVSVSATDESGNTHTETFNVHVVDMIPPVIEYTGETTLEVGDPPYDFTLYATAIDNLDGDITHLMTLVNPVDYNVTGDYTITFFVTDSNMNYSELDVIISVVDTTSPTFDLPLSETIELGSLNIDWTTYMTNIQDNSGESVSVVEIQDNVNYYVEGTYNVIVRATDNYGNFTQDSLTVYVEDTIAPTCDPISDQTYEVNTVSAVNYEQYVTNIFDLSLDLIEINWVDTVDYSTVGTYDMSVTLTDASSNPYTVYFTVFIVDTIAPEITYMGPTLLEVGDVEPIWSGEVMLTDNSGDEVIILDISEDVNMLSEGLYHVFYTVEDLSGNPQYLEVMIDVIDTTAPTFDYIDDQIYYTGDPYPVEWSIYVTNLVENSEDGVMYFYNDYVEYNEPGIYMVEIFAYDMSGNMFGRMFFVEVVDITPPNIMIYGDVEVGLNTYPDIYNFFEAYDDVSGEVTFTAYIDDSELDISSVGTYNVYITVEDSSGNVASDSILVHVHDLYPPTFDSIEDMIFELGEISEYDWLTLVENLDDDSGMVPTVYIIIDEVDFTLPGTYQVGIRAEDDSMNYIDSFFDVMIEDTVPPVLDPISDMEIGPEVVEVTIMDITTNATDASMDITFDFNCPTILYGTLGNYICSVTAVDSSGNSSTEYFIISIIDDTPPLFELNGIETITLELGEEYTEQGATCLEDDCSIEIYGIVVDSEVGIFTIEYHAEDAQQNRSILLRTVIIEDTTPPELILNPGIDTILDGEVHVDSGVSVFDLSETTVEVLKIETDITGQWKLEYTATDEYENSSTIIRMVNVRESDAEVEFEFGAFQSTLQLGDVFTPPMCLIKIDGNQIPCVLNTGLVDTNTLGRVEFTAQGEYQGKTYEVTRYAWVFDNEVDVQPVGYWKKEEEVIV